MNENVQMTNKSALLKLVYDFFVDSNDFNGIPLRSISEQLEISYDKSIDIIIELVSDGDLSIMSSTNPHIIGFQHYKKEEQYHILEEARNITVTTEQFGSFTFSRENTEFPICVYPSPDFLKANRDLFIFGNAEYTKQLALASPQLKLAYFDIEVLERYANDPRYAFKFNDYSGDIYCNFDEMGKPLVREEDVIFLKSFGLGYDNEGNRLAVVPLIYLNDLSPEHQVYWFGKEYKGEAKVLQEYYENIIKGNWTFSSSVFSAFIGEQNCLNDLCEHIFGKKLFLKSYQREERPREFTFFFRPTRKNYLDFILLLDKMISDNIDKDFFKGSIELDEIISMGDGIVERRLKGTLRLFEEWMRKEYTDADDALTEIFKVFKAIRKERQEPAHKITTNDYDKEYDEKQKQIIGQAYNSMMNLRVAFASHPLASGYQVPKWLKEGHIKPF